MKIVFSKSSACKDSTRQTEKEDQQTDIAKSLQCNDISRKDIDFPVDSTLSTSLENS